jgi:Cysteine rich repeat
MTRLMIFPLLLIASAAFAQDGQRPDPGCARDVARHCRAKMNDGDSAILACLKEHRAALSKACAKVLTDNGQ